MASKAILWFRNNLRLKDNRCLHYAAINNIAVLPIYILDERLDVPIHPSFKRCGDKRKNWLYANLYSLQKEFENLDAKLYIKKGNVVATLKEIVLQTGITTIITNYEPGAEEENDILRLKQEGNIRLIVLFDNFLIQPEKLPFSIDQLPLIFTDFRIKIEKFYKEEIFSSNLLPKFIKCDYFETQNIHCLNNNILFVAGEYGAFQRVQYYFFESKLISRYKETRNQLLGSDFSSHFSPWLALGVLSPQTILKYLRQYEKENGANESTYWLWFELLWKDFFRFQMMKYKNLFFRKGGIRNKKIDFLNDKLLFEQWMNGKTEEPFVNANMIELNQTGFMSNRGRQNVASYLIHDLGIDWRLGAWYFESQLIDYDVSSNWGNWAYIAGVGNDPRPFRKFNIKKQQEQYDSDNRYTEYWLSKSNIY
jgi:deoxyribodipyrimidine photo-lyase